MYCIAIDDGHGKGTAGKRTPFFSDGSYMEENAYNKAVANLLAKMLERCGFRVLFVAPEEEDTPLKTRVQRANDAKADVYVSIHANAFGNGWNDANGVESWVYKNADARTRKFAGCVHQYFVKALGRKDRGLKTSSDLYVLNSTKMPAVLVEGGFMTNKEEAKLLLSEEYRKKSAEGICRGICAFFGVKFVDDKEDDEDVKRYQTLDELPYGREIMEKLVAEGVISGDENGNLNLTDDMIRIFMILDRKHLL